MLIDTIVALTRKFYISFVKNCSLMSTEKQATFSQKFLFVFSFSDPFSIYYLLFLTLSFYYLDDGSNQINTPFF